MRGIYVALATPFDQNGRIDGGQLKKLVDKTALEGADGFFVGGSSGECFLLSEAERIQLLEMVASHAPEQPLIAHVGALSTGEAIRYALAAKRFGYGYIAATPPFYYGFTMKQIAAYYYSIVKAAEMPVMIYNFPGNTGKTFDCGDADFQELLRSGAVFGIKHTSLDLYQMERIRAIKPELTIMNGYDETMVAGMALGADGSIGSTFNVMLPHYRKIYAAVQRRDPDAALHLQTKANSIMQAFCREGLIPSIKYMLTRQGVAAGAPRAPFQPLSPDACARIDEVVRLYLEND